MEKELDIIFLRPKKFEDCDFCVDYVGKDKIVHINLKNLNERDARRVFDYVSGAVYIKEAKIVDLGENMFCCIPKTKEFKMEYDQPNSRTNEVEEIIPFAK